MAVFSIGGSAGKTLNDLVALPGGGFALIFSTFDGLDATQVDLRLFEPEGAEGAAQIGDAIAVEVVGQLTVPLLLPRSDGGATLLSHVRNFGSAPELQAVRFDGLGVELGRQTHVAAGLGDDRVGNAGAPGAPDFWYVDENLDLRNMSPNGDPRLDFVSLPGTQIGTATTYLDAGLAAILLNSGSGVAVRTLALDEAPRVAPKFDISPVARPSFPDAAGNRLVFSSGIDSDDDFVIDGFSLFVADPSGAAAEKTTTFKQAGAVFSKQRVIELEGIGFAVEVLKSARAGGATLSRDLHLYDLQGFEIGSAPLPGPGRLVQLVDPDGGDTLRILSVASDGAADAAARILTFQPRLDTLGTLLDDTLFGLGRNDRLRGLDGDDVLLGRGGDDRIDGGRGSDGVQGGKGDDRIDGGEGVDFIGGGGGDDTVDGGGGVDGINGDAGDDVLRGGGGSDVVGGGEGNDVLRGNAGNDALSGEAGDNDLAGGGGDDSLSGGEGDDRLAGDDGDDALFGDAGRDTLDGGDGKDVLDGGAGGDRLSGGADRDVLRAGEGDDDLDGGAGKDRLDGGAGDDELIGGAGADVLTGGAGADFMEGGAGRDRYVFKDVSEVSAEDEDDTLIDAIADFSFRDRDRIDLRGIDADPATQRDDAFVLAPASGFTGRRGELMIVERDRGGVLVAGDLDGDRSTDFAFEVERVSGLNASDFML